MSRARTAGTLAAAVAVAVALTLVDSFAASSPTPARADRQQTVEPLDLATFYLLGDYDAVETALRQASTGNLDVVIEAFRQGGPRWIDADGAQWSSHRRFVIATVALEAARAGLDTQWSNSKQLIRWACELLRSRPPQREERGWQLAAIALFEGARDLDALGAHLDHVRARFPDEPRLLLADAFRRESEFQDDATRLGQELGPGRRARIFDAALAHPATAAEAHLRLGYMLLRDRTIEPALEHLRQVAPVDDPGQVYLARLFEGWALQRQDKAADAERAFRQALDAVPRAYTASLMLALHHYRTGNPAEGDALMHDVALADPPVVDPWRIYGYADLRRWPILIRELRAGLR